MNDIDKAKTERARTYLKAGTGGHAFIDGRLHWQFTIIGPEDEAGTTWEVVTYDWVIGEPHDHKTLSAEQLLDESRTVLYPSPEIMAKALHAIQSGASGQ